VTASIVQSKQGGGSGISGTLNITLGAGTTAGSACIAAIGNNAGITADSVTLGGTGLTRDARKTSAGGTVGEASIWSLANVAASQTAVAVNHTGSWSPGVTVYEAAGLATSSMFDVAPAGGSSNAGSQSSFDSGSTTSTQAAELWVGVCVSFLSGTHVTITPTGAGTWTPDTNISEGSSTDIRTATQIVSSTGTLQYTGSLSPSAQGWTAIAAAYKAAGSSAHNDTAALAVTPARSNTLVHAATKQPSLTIRPVFANTVTGGRKVPGGGPDRHRWWRL